MRRPESERASAQSSDVPSSAPVGKPGRPSRAQRARDNASAQAKRELKEAVSARKAFERDEQRRFTAHLRRRRVTVLVSLGAVVGLAIFIGVGVFSPLMSVRTITISGTHLVSAATIHKDLESQLGRPLPLVDTSLIRSTLAKQPLIKSYSIQSIPPDSLVINIVERSPIAYLKTSNGYSLVDPAGVSIEVTPTRLKNYPLITVAGGSPTARGFPGAVAVLNALPASVRSQVTEIQAESTDNVVLTLNGSGARVVWGSAEQSALKAKVLAALMAQYPPQATSVYDVSSPASVVVR